MDGTNYNVIDNETSEANNNVIDNVISEYYLEKFDNFFAGHEDFTSSKTLINCAVAKMEKFLEKFNGYPESVRLEIVSRYDYKTYLKSPYWEYVSSVIKTLNNFTCCKCNARRSSKMAVHHKTYEHMGSELFHMEDLEVICNSCHMKEHEIGGENEQ